MEGEWRTLVELREKLEAYPKLQARSDVLARELRECAAELAQREEVLQSEQEDLRQVEGLTFGAIALLLRGERQKRIDLEREEWLAAKVRYDECQRRRLRLEAERAKVAASLAERPVTERRYREMLGSVHQQLFTRLQADEASGLEGLFAKLSAERLTEREVGEAIQAARQVLASLTPAVDELQRADTIAQRDTWGFDPNGFVGFNAKYSHFDRALAHLRDIDGELERLKRELKDIGAHEGGLNLEVTEPAFRAIDILIDNVFSEHEAAGKIGNSYQSAQALEGRVHDLIHQLEQRAARGSERIRALEFEAGAALEAVQARTPKLR
ncbi:MAG: hypothetical protein HY901_33220 [Deltaproteobacteria bacterium]|nr:hypothetical protein [Deltaproteobacteria bacterium]